MAVIELTVTEDRLGDELIETLVPARSGFDLSEGAYTIQDVSLYLRATTPAEHMKPVDWAQSSRRPYPKATSQAIAAWIRRSVDVEAVELGGRRRALHFHDLIRMRMIALLRSRGISFKAIRESELFAQDLTGSRNPFATEDLWHSDSDIFLSFRERIISTAEQQGQYAMDLLEPYLKRVDHHPGLTFGGDGLASLWRPHHSVALDPHIGFGAPCIEHTRIQTEVLWSLRNAGESLEALADVYEIAPDKVNAAIEWERRLVNAA